MKKVELYKKEKEGKVRCLACAHKCLISEGQTGICGVRKNIKGELYSFVHGKIVSLHVDPIEKKPFYHFLPGTKAMSFGTVGCNFHCPWCQNWDISQAREVGIFGGEITPKEIVAKAIETGCKSIAYTYNEPIIFVEFAKEVCKLARKKGLKNLFVTNGHWSKESFDYISDYVDAMNVDLKTFDEKKYLATIGGKLKAVLETIKRAHKKGIHIEITTLLIPDFNDSDEELEKIAKFIASVDKKIPWHISRFFPMYKMTDRPPTPLKSLKRAEEIGKKYLDYVHLGNV